MIGIGDIREDKELAKLIYDHCKKRQKELIEEYENLWHRKIKIYF